MASQQSTIVISSEREKWRLECPDGHKNIRVWDGVFSCTTCKRNRDGGEDTATVYETIRDTKTGRMVTREDITFQIDAGQPVKSD